jgi:23S rRNA pseudouridine1911/1915/1917 synthase
MKLKILYENENLLVLDKPAGWVAHGDGKTKTPNISDYILKNFKKLKGVGESLEILIGEEKLVIEKPGIVHRLDKDTTGCLLIAKTQKSYENLKKQFQEHKVQKEYVALLWGSVRYDTGLVDLPIARSKNDFRKKEVVKITSSTREKFRGTERDAVTRYKVLKRFELLGQKVSLVNFYPETGRMHQIRIHSKSLGHPIVGDHLYGKTDEVWEKKLFGKLPVRHLLHAEKISFHNPFSGETIEVKSPVPKDFSNALKKHR